jgi:hypothetical protein
MNVKLRNEAVIIHRKVSLSSEALREQGVKTAALAGRV